MTPAPVTARARVCFYITRLCPARCFAGFSAQLGRPFPVFFRFLLHPGTDLTVTYRCTGDGTLEIAAKESGASALVFPVTASNTWQTAMGTLQLDGEQELWFTYRGTGALDLRGFKL